MTPEEKAKDRADLISAYVSARKKASTAWTTYRDIGRRRKAGREAYQTYQAYNRSADGLMWQIQMRHGLDAVQQAYDALDQATPQAA